MVKLIFKIIVSLIFLFTASYCIMIAIKEESLFYAVFGWFNVWMYQKVIKDKDNE